MTFVLKDFAQLKEHFADTITIFLRRAKVDTVDKLSEPRRLQINFINAVITALEEMQASSDLKAKTLYGAMSVIKFHINDNLRMTEQARDSRLYARLNDAMGITDSSRPDAQQYLECYRGLNKFFNIVFKAGDSRKGFADAHQLHDIPTDVLADLMNRSYRLEEANFNAVIKGYGTVNVSVEAKTYRIHKEIAPSIIEQFDSWSNLKDALHDLILSELADKNVPNISKLGKARAAQLSFLQSLSESLSTIPANGLKLSERIAILAGAMHIVRCQIGAEYGKEPLNQDDIIASLVHTKLTDILNAKRGSFENIEALVTAANKFIHHMVIEPETIRSSARAVIPAGVRAQNLFSKIQGFDLITVMEQIQRIITVCRSSALELIVMRQKRELAAAASVASAPSLLGSLSSMLFGRKQPTKASDDAKTLESIVEAGEREAEKEEKAAWISQAPKIS